MAEAIAAVGVRRGDAVFSHSNVGFFGYPEEGRTAELVCRTVLDAFTDVIGEDGTLVVPAFTYSFCRGEIYDVAGTPSTCGMFSEFVRQLPGAVRSHDPIFSVAAFGRKARALAGDVPAECFGEDSFWGRFLEEDGIFCNLNFDAGSTFAHYAERVLQVPYRQDKTFSGEIVIDGEPTPAQAVFFCRKDLDDPGSEAAFEAFDRVAREKGVAHVARVGRGAVVGIRARATFDLIETELGSNPSLLTTAATRG